MDTIRVGVLGAANILRTALIKPAAIIPGLEVSAIAARERTRAEDVAQCNQIRRVHTSYSELLADPHIDAVYIPLPAALHAQWTTAAIDAGKHVLCEKPFTSNAASAAAVADHAENSDRIVMEAYHSHYHPLYGELRAILASGEIGTPSHAHAEFCIPLRPGPDIRWNLALGGGSLLDVGYYSVRALTELFGAPERVVDARAWMTREVDRRVDATLSYPGGVEGTIVSSMWSSHLLSMKLRIRGTAGTVRVSFPYQPQLGTRIRVDGIDGKRTLRTDKRSTYWHQLRAFRDAIEAGTGVPTDARAGAKHMQLLESIYEAAGVAPRP